MNGSVIRTVDAAVLKTGSPLDLAAVPDLDVLDVSGINNDHIRAYGSHIRRHTFHIMGNHLLQPGYHLRPMAV